MFLLRDDNKSAFKYKRIVAISAGGTGGHIFPALSIAKALIQEGFFVIFFSDRRLLNYLKKNDVLLCCEQFKVIQLCIHNAPRWKQMFMIVKDLWKCKSLLTSRVSLCLGFGGLASFPPMLFGILTFKKIIIHEQNAVMGLANRLLLPFVKKCCLTYENTARIPLRFKKKCVVTGSPLRSEIKELVYSYDNPSVNYRAFYKIDDIINLTIVGGAQACSVFDEILPQAIASLPNDIANKLYVHHQCKIENCERLKSFYTQHNIDNDVRPFFYHVGALFRESHLVISRAGASTISELTALGVPSILIPLPISANNHQYENAKILRDSNGTILLEQKTLTKDTLCQILMNLFYHDRLLAEMSYSAYKVSKINADVFMLGLINKILGISNDILYSQQVQRPSVKNIRYINDNVGLG